MNLLVGLIITILIAAVVIWIVSKLNLGLSVDGYGSAIIAAIVIAIVNAIVFWLLGLLGITVGGGFWGAIVLLIIAAVVLLLSDKILPGMKVDGFLGAIIAAIAIAVVSWLLVWLLALIGIAL
jgi:putative membrane protein